MTRLRSPTDRRPGFLESTLTSASAPFLSRFYCYGHRFLWSDGDKCGRVWLHSVFISSPVCGLVYPVFADSTFSASAFLVFGSLKYPTTAMATSSAALP